MHNFSKKKNEISISSSTLFNIMLVHIVFLVSVYKALLNAHSITNQSRINKPLFQALIMEQKE